ncbi:MAG: ABC transporter permease [Tuberibacillus sp.]
MIMINPRWKKVFKDLWLHKFKTALVIISIAMSIAGIGMIGQGSYILMVGMKHSFEQVKPSSGMVYTEPFTRDLLKDIKSIKGIDKVQGKTALSARVQPANGSDLDFKKWKKFNLYSLDYEHQLMDVVFSKHGQWPDRKGALFLEKTTLDSFDLKVGDKVWVETPNGVRKKLRVAGVVRAPGLETTFLSKTGYGYIDFRSLEWLGYPRKWNIISYTTSGKYDSQYSQNIADQIKSRLLHQGIHVHSTHVPAKMQHWAYDIVESMTIVLQQLGLLVFISGVGIMVNTIGSILNNQVKQIGIMQSIGATPKQLFSMYITNVFIYCLFSLFIGIPLGMMGARSITQYSAKILGFDSSSIGYSHKIILFQVLVGVWIPILASGLPILKGSRITIREAIYGTQKQSQSLIGKTWRLPWQLTASFLLSFRNTFRKKVRLCVSLLALTLSGAVILSVFTVYSSMSLTNENSLKYTKYDLQLAISHPVSRQRLKMIKDLPQVAEMETWNQFYGNRIRDDGTVSRDLRIIVPKANTRMIEPDVVKGRWLKPTDQNVIVLDTYLLRYEKDIQIGKEITINVNGKNKKLKVIGLVRKVNGEVTSYADAHALDGIARSNDTGNLINVKAKEASRTTVTVLLQRSTEALRKNGLLVTSSKLTIDENDKLNARSNVLLIFLMAMGVLILFVSTIGLMGNTSLNIMERIREIGVLRSLGASNLWIYKIITIEGILTCFFAWGLAVILSFPVSHVLSHEIGAALFQAPLDYSYSYGGILVWLVASMAVGIIASSIPVYSSIRQPVRDVLSFE